MCTPQACVALIHHYVYQVCTDREGRTLARKSAKSETLTIRLDPKTRFMLEFVARLRGQTITTVVERAIADAADAATIPEFDFVGKKTGELNWKQFWDVAQGIREIKMAEEPA